MALLLQQNASWQHEDIVPRDSFYQHFFPHVYPNGSPSPAVNNHRLAVVYMVFATSSLFDLNMPAQNKSSRKYYALARACLAWNSTASVAMVQALHLMVNFLMHSEKATIGGEASWPLLRLAVAASQSIGLHRDGANWQLRPEEVEERRRVFWEIHAYDIQQSISLGRPRAMSSATIDARFPGAGSENPLLTGQYLGHHSLETTQPGSLCRHLFLQRRNKSICSAASSRRSTIFRPLP